MQTISLCLAFAAAKARAQTIQVSGRVLTVAGQPIPEARVTWRQIGAPTDPRAQQPFATTNAEGEFTFAPAAPGQYGLIATKTGWLHSKTGTSH